MPALGAQTNYTTIGVLERTLLNNYVSKMLSSQKKFILEMPSLIKNFLKIMMELSSSSSEFLVQLEAGSHPTSLT